VPIKGPRSTPNLSCRFSVTQSILNNSSFGPWTIKRDNLQAMPPEGYFVPSCEPRLDSPRSEDLSQVCVRIVTNGLNQIFHSIERTNSRTQHATGVCLRPNGKRESAFGLVLPRYANCPRAATGFSLGEIPRAATLKLVASSPSTWNGPSTSSGSCLSQWLPFLENLSVGFHRLMRTFQIGRTVAGFLRVKDNRFRV
jgi:hypothetical protein